MGCTVLFKHRCASRAPEAKGTGIWSSAVNPNLIFWQKSFCSVLVGKHSVPFPGLLVFYPLKNCCETTAAGTQNTFWCSLSTPYYATVTHAHLVLTFGADSTSLLFLRSQPAPSRKRPYMYTPPMSAGGGPTTSSFIILVTSLCKTTLSSAHPFATFMRVVSCLIAVRNP